MHYIRLIPLYSLLFFFLFSLFACSDENDSTKYKFRVDLATAYKKNDSYYFELDDGKILYPLALNETMEAQLTNNCRVSIQYDIVEEKKNNKGESTWIKVYSLVRVSSGRILLLTEENKEKVGNDPLEVESIWISGNYINFYFYIYGNTETHTLSLVYDPATNSLLSDTLKLEIRHNAFNDFEAYRKKGIISFDIQELAGRKPLPIAISINTYKDGIKIYNRILK
ncbi:MAG: hypothetical protein LUG18_04950 [Candidatus Azobacteroides sp.]|nr:hypothetical protein [Candidatus Azobacteroides sp.]